MSVSEIVMRKKNQNLQLNFLSSKLEHILNYLFCLLFSLTVLIKTVSTHHDSILLVPSPSFERLVYPWASLLFTAGKRLAFNIVHIYVKKCLCFCFIYKLIEVRSEWHRPRVTRSTDFLAGPPPPLESGGKW